MTGRQHDDVDLEELVDLDAIDLDHEMGDPERVRGTSSRRSPPARSGPRRGSGRRLDG
jgi:hypothetical protein